MKTQRNQTISLIRNILVIIFLCLSGSESTNLKVLDSDGNELQANTKYKIIPAHRGGGSGGGLGLSQRDGRYSCPSNVVQLNFEDSLGLSLKIFPVDRTQQLISLSVDVNILFTAYTICVQPTVWRLGDVDPYTGRTYVRTAGKLGSPGAETVKNWFKIEKYGKGYKIVYCPSVCSTCKIQCGDVGVFVERGSRWLGLNGEPFIILFKKVVT